MADQERSLEESLLREPQELYDLFTSLSTCDTDELADALNQELEAALAWLRFPLAFPSPKAEARQRIQTDKTIPAYRIEEIIFLSDYLHISEDFATVILTTASEQSSRHGRTPTETAVKVFHDLVSLRLECVKWVIAAPSTVILTEEMPVTNQVITAAFNALYTKSRFETQSGLSVDGFGDSIFKQLALCSQWMAETMPGDKRISQAVKLHEDVQVLRVQSARSHQRALAKCFYEVAALGELLKMDLIGLVKWLKAREELDGTTILMVSAFFAAIQHNPEDGSPYEAYAEYPRAVRDFIEDEACLQIVTTLIIVHNEWKQEWISRVLMLGWGLLVDKAYRHDRHRISFGKWLDKGPEPRILEAIENDAFQYMRVLLIPSADVPGSLWPKARKDARDRGVPHLMQDRWPEVEPEYQKDALRQVDSLIKDMIGSFQFVKKLKNKQEDNLKALELKEEEPTGEEGRQDFIALVDLVITVYRELPLDHDDKLWVDSKFLNLVADTEGVAGRALLCRLLLAISSGSAGSYWLYSYLAKDTSEVNLEDMHTHFDWVASKKIPVSRLAGTAAAMSRGMEVNALSDPEVAPEDALCLAYYCEMLSIILRWHPQLAGEVADTYKTLKRLWELLNRSIPLELSVAVLDTLTSIVSPAVAVHTQGIAEACLSALDTLNVTGRSRRAEITRPTSGFPTSTAEANAAWLTSLEDHDAALNSSLNRIALINLFRALTGISDPGDAYLSLSDPAQISSVRSLRTRMTEYVLNDAFQTAISMIQSGNPHSGYTLLESILQFVETAISELNLKALLEPTPQRKSTNQSETDRLDVLQQHPGFVALGRLLGDETIREALFTAARLRVAEGLPEAVPSSLFAKISFRALRILRTVIDQQGIFLEVILPSLRRSTQSPNAGMEWVTSNFHPIDWHLAHQPETITQIASFVSADVSDGLAMETIAFLRQLGQSIHMTVPFLFGGRTVQGNILTYVFRDAPNSNVIMAGFVDRIERGDNEAVVDPEILPSRLIPAYDKDIEARIPKRVQQHQILDLLLENTNPERSDITFAHFLLGFLESGASGRGMVKSILRDGPQAGTVIENGTVKEVLQTVPRTCLHVVVDRLSSCLPQLHSHEESDIISIVADSPELGYKCVKLLRQLIQNNLTSHLTARYLRGQEDLIHRSLVYLPVVPESTGQGSQGSAIYEDGSTLRCEAIEMTHFLRYQAEVFNLAAFELHLLEMNAAEAVHIIQALFRPSSVSGQPLRGVLALTALSCLNFEWEAQQAEPNAAGFDTIDFNAFLKPNMDGAQVYSIDKVSRTMRKEIERLQRKLPSLERDAAMESSRLEILGYLNSENGNAEVKNAVKLSLDAWSTIVNAVLTKCSESTTASVSRATIFELSTACLSSMLNPAMRVSEKAETLSSTLLTLTGALTQLEQRESGDKPTGPPVDRLQIILACICQAIADGEISEIARGMLYAVLVDYLKLVHRYASSTGAEKGETLAWMAAILQPIYTELDRLLNIVGRDALNGSVDWQLVSYTLLDQIFVVFEDKTDVIVQHLARRGLVHNFLAAIRVADSSIYGIFTADTVDINPLFVLEAQLGMLSRIASTSSGSQTLIEAGVFESFAACRFIGARPAVTANENTRNAMALERYHRAFIPVMKLLVDVAGVAGDRGYKSASQFVEQQQEILLPFFRIDAMEFTLLGLEALETVVRFLFIIADDERKVVKKTKAVLSGYASVIRQTAVALFNGSDLTLQIQPTNAEQQLDAETAQLFEDSTRFQARIQSVLYGLRRSLLGYYVDVTGSTNDIQPVIIAGGQLGYDRQATRGGADFVNFGDLVAALADSIGRYTSMTSLHTTLARLIEEDIGVLSEKELGELAATDHEGSFEALSRPYRRALATNQLKHRRVLAAEETRIALQSIESILVLLYRHVRFYNGLIAEQTAPSRRYQAPSLQKAVEQDIVLAWHTDVTEALAGIAPNLQLLMNIHLPDGIIADQESREACLRILAEGVANLQPVGNTS